MREMFKNSDFNQPIGDWDVSNVTTMSSMFQQVSINTPVTFNQPIVTGMYLMSYMSSMFSGTLNQPIGNWNTSNVIDMSHMFYM